MSRLRAGLGVSRLRAGLGGSRLRVGLGWVRARYGSNPLHLLALFACFALAGYAADRMAGAPMAARMGVWFIGAVIGHDFVLYPLYALADRTLTRLRGRRRPGAADGSWPPAVNYLRVPGLIAGLLFMLWFPLILGLSTPEYRAASGLTPSPYLGRWLLVTGVVFGVSAVLYAIRLGRRAASRRSAAPAVREPRPAARPTR